jgi:hypothetical protein
LDANRRRLDELIQARHTRAAQGLDQHLPGLV